MLHTLERSAGAAIVACVLLGCGNNVVVSPADASASGGTSGTGGSAPKPEGNCIGEERWAEMPGGPLNFTSGAWTGSELLLWEHGALVGHRFLSETNTWRNMAPIPPVLSTLFQPVAIAAGRFFVWDDGGGAAYDWDADSWTPISSMDGAPPLAESDVTHPGVGTPTRLYYVAFTAAGFSRKSYRVASDTWTALPDQSAPATRRPIVQWANTMLLVWGGYDANIGDATNEGARYDPATMSWSPMTMANAPSPMVMKTAAVWTGTRLFVWGNADYAVPDGGLYDPVQDTWTRVTADGAPVKKAGLAVWTGKDVIVLGADSGSNGIYDPSNNTWHPMKDAPVGDPWRVAVWDGCRVLAQTLASGLYAYEPPPDL